MNNGPRLHPVRYAGLRFERPVAVAQEICLSHTMVNLESRQPESEPLLLAIFDQLVRERLARLKVTAQLKNIAKYAGGECYAQRMIDFLRERDCQLGSLQPLVGKAENPEDKTFILRGDDSGLLAV